MPRFSAARDATSTQPSFFLKNEVFEAPVAKAIATKEQTVLAREALIFAFFLGVDLREGGGVLLAAGGCCFGKGMTFDDSFI
jgi:hypothetical protein